MELTNISLCRPVSCEWSQVFYEHRIDLNLVSFGESVYPDSGFSMVYGIEVETDVPGSLGHGIKFHLNSAPLALNLNYPVYTFLLGVGPVISVDDFEAHSSKNRIK